VAPILLIFLRIKLTTVYACHLAILLVWHTIEHEQVLRADLNNSEIRYTKNYVFSWQGVCTHPTHLVCLRHWRTVKTPYTRKLRHSTAAVTFDVTISALAISVSNVSIHHTYAVARRQINAEQNCSCH